VAANRPASARLSAVATAGRLPATYTTAWGTTGISSATFYKWKAKYGGLDVSEARRLKSLEDENRRLKKLLAEAMLDNSALKDLLGKNV